MNEKVILLVDDNPNDEALCIRALRMNNITNEIIAAQDGVEALNLLFGEDGRSPIKPVIVLLDLKLPKLDGIETPNRIRANVMPQCLPVVMLTTSDQESDVLRFYQSGVNSFIQKPVDYTESSNIAQLLGNY